MSPTGLCRESRGSLECLWHGNPTGGARKQCMRERGVWGELINSEMGRGQARNADFILSYREKASYVIKIYKYESGGL